MTTLADAHKWQTTDRFIDGVAFCDLVADPSPLPLALKEAFDKPHHSQRHGWPRYVWVRYRSCSDCSEVELPVALCIACAVRADMDHTNPFRGRGEVQVASASIGFLTSDFYVWHWWSLCAECFTALAIPANVLQNAKRIPERLLSPLVLTTKYPEFFVTEFDVRRQGPL